MYGRRTFRRRILDLINSMASTAKYRLSQSFYRDLSWWDSFLHVFNCRRPFLDHKPTVDVMTDSNSLAAGAFLRGDWIYFNFELDCPSWLSLQINHKEMLAIILAAKRWALQWANHRVLIHSDNLVAAHLLAKGRRQTHLSWRNCVTYCGCRHDTISTSLPCTSKAFETLLLMLSPAFTSRSFFPALIPRY